MAILLILLLVAVVVVFMQRKKAPEMATPVLYGLVALIFIVSGARLFCSGTRGTTMTEALAAAQLFDQAAGFRLGQAVAEDLPSGSQVLVIHGGTFSDAMRRLLEARVEAVKKGMGSSYSAVVEAMPHAQQSDEEEYEPLDEPLLTAPIFAQLVSKHPEAKAVVSLVGAPLFRTPPPPGSVPPLYVMGGMDEELTRVLLQRGVVRAAVAYQTSGVDWNARPTRGMSEAEVFNLRFELLRPTR